MANTLIVTKWSILRIHTKDGKIEYRVFGDNNGGVALSDALVEIDKGAKTAMTIKDREVEMQGLSTPYKDSEYFDTMESHKEYMGYKSVTDMTEVVTTRTFLPPEDYQTKAAREESDKQEAEKKAQKEERAKTNAEKAKKAEKKAA
jgi:hypothetical protein